MSDDPFDDPEWKEYARRAREELLPKVEGSAIGVSIYNGKTDPKIAIEMGYMILLDKPIIVAVTPGVTVPSKLVGVADEIIEVDLDDPASTAKRLNAAVRRILGESGQSAP